MQILAIRVQVGGWVGPQEILVQILAIRVQVGGWVGPQEILVQILAIRAQAGMQRICLLTPAEFPAVHLFPSCTHSPTNHPHLYAG